MQEDTGRSPGEVAKAFTITRETLDARALWAQIDALDGKVPESVQIDALLVIWNLQRTFTRWLLARPGAIPDIATAVERYHDGFRDIRAGSGILPDSQRPAYLASLRDWKDKGLSDELAGQLAALPYLGSCTDIIEIARERKLKVVDVARVYFRLGDVLNLPWLSGQIDGLKVDGRWHAVARGVLRDELAHHQRVLVDQVLTMAGATADAKVKAWADRWPRRRPSTTRPLRSPCSVSRSSHRAAERLHATSPSPDGAKRSAGEPQVRVTMSALAHGARAGTRVGVRGLQDGMPGPARPLIRRCRATFSRW
jgi:glutamate dehydrogenase